MTDGEFPHEITIRQNGLGVNVHRTDVFIIYCCPLVDMWLSTQDLSRGGGARQVFKVP